MVDGPQRTKMLMNLCTPCVIAKMENNLVGRFNPSEKVIVKMGSSSPIFGMNIKQVYLKSPPGNRGEARDISHVEKH